MLASGRKPHKSCVGNCERLQMAVATFPGRLGRVVNGRTVKSLHGGDSASVVGVLALHLAQALEPDPMCELVMRLRREYICIKIREQ